ncbi:MAG TPA: hypothetical protein VNL15_06610, partial [Dehalococcoidia bacterium]|nr:hypothetical protein [Dehalococcoidia bacterium]
MSDSEGTYSRLIEVERQKGQPVKQPSPAQPAKAKEPREAQEDLATTPYISQNYRFTEDELRWLRRQAYTLSERFGSKVSQNTILRVAIRFLRETCLKNPKRNPLHDAIS